MMRLVEKEENEYNEKGKEGILNTIFIYIGNENREKIRFTRPLLYNTDEK
jgi:hypothetical protein